jgi:putative tryptophan/tyrosine transport system substrate-binding protein
MVTSRRTFMLSVAAVLVAWPRFAATQPKRRMFRVGVLSPGLPPLGPLEALREGLRDLGYEDGRNITIEWRFAGETNDNLGTLADELVRLDVDVIVAINTQASLAVKRATVTTPIVIARVSDPVRTGLVASFAHPGGNVTGLSNFSDELSSKRLGLIKEIVPTISQLAVLWNGGNPGIELSVREMEGASAQFGVHVRSHAVRTPGDFGTVFEDIARERAGAVFVFDDVLVTTHSRQILDWAARIGLPVISQYAEFAEAGAVMAYGPSISDIYRHAASYVDKILKGAKPAELPVEQPTRVELVLNLQSAKALGMRIPDAIIVRADRVLRES